MNNILLLEPGYQAKYPPLGLMKIAYYHKYIRNDNNVLFAKGRFTNDQQLTLIKWDRIYVSTLFTYEWKETIDAIEYAKQLLQGETSRLIVGGSAATLMPDDFEKETGVRPIVGLLNEPNKIGFSDDHLIDSLPPDYSILLHSEYKYSNDKAYYAFTTRGCGMNCSFCAVKILEPEYIDYIPIKEQINAVREMDQVNGIAGELRKDLILLDNNVLKSRKLKDIVRDLEELGFYKGATCINQLTGKSNRRYVDFNQGLDASFLTKDKAKLLGRLSLKPVRIAFDHIEDKNIYRNALINCYNAGLTEFSNYILYNTDDTTGKGNKYDPDKPEDLYNRLRITMDIKEYINFESNSSKSISIYSFPMKYIPLNYKSRSYVGYNWNKKFLRAIQVMLMPTQGKGVAGKGFFEAAFGKNVEEFMMFLHMPEEIISRRGKINKTKSILSFKDLEMIRKKEIHEKLQKEWTRLFECIKSSSNLLKIIGDNSFTAEKYYQITTDKMKLIYLYYLSPTELLKLFSSINDLNNKKLLQFYFNNDAYFYLQEVLSKAIASNYNFRKLSGVYNIFGKSGIIELIKTWLDRKCVDKDFVNNLNNLCLYLNIANPFEQSLLITLKLFVMNDTFSSKELDLVKDYIINLDHLALKKILFSKLPELKENIEEQLSKEKTGSDILRKEYNIVLLRIEELLAIEKEVERL